jgi:hypothetical protein
VRGFEPPRQRHMILNHARLPFRHTRSRPRGERRDLNPRPLGPQPSALPSELRSPCFSTPVIRHRSEGAPGRIRTCDPRIRSPLLYPAELQAHMPSRPLWLSTGERAGDGIRTRDKRLGRPMLCQLSYTRLRMSCCSNRTMVGTRGFEPPTPCSQSRCATRLRHVPSSVRLRLRPREYSVSPHGLTLRAFVDYTGAVEERPRHGREERV